MALEIDDVDTVADDGINAFKSRFAGRDLGKRGFLGLTARSVAMIVWGLLRAAKVVDNDAVPSSDSSTSALEKWAFALGLPSNAGGYGRNQATAATGGVATLTGAPGTFYADGTELVASDGVTLFALSGAVTLPGGGSASGNIIATTKGVAGNLDAGAVLSWVTTPSGADESVALTSPTEGAVDIETPAALLERILARLQTPPKGGAEPDYLLWALVTGVYEVFEYPHRDGTGTVDLVIVTAGKGQARVPSGAVQTAALAAVNAARPVTVNGVRVVLPDMPDDVGKTVRVRPVPSAAKYAFDWDSTGATYTVDLYTPGTPATLRLNTLAPATLNAAIIDGQTPRLQVLATGGSVVPVLVRCTAKAEAGGKTTLTLESPLPDGWTPPSVGDAVYAGGPMCALIAPLIEAYVDALGPSRASGFADEVTTWEDTIEYLQLARIALDAVDTDGTKVAKNLVALPTIDGVAADVQATDATSEGPELLYLEHVAVTP